MPFFDDPSPLRAQNILTNNFSRRLEPVQNLGMIHIPPPLSILKMAEFLL